MLKVLHNNRCGKSREAIKILEELKLPFEVVNYLTNSLSKVEIQRINQLTMKPLVEMIRTNEEIWKTKYKGNEMTDEELLLALELHPILIERPLVYSEKFALVARPPQKILDFLYSF